ncbi:hypothetical protein L7F22_065054 [Adiantum nelumboides]|nr:hypothetical protein [Adiantum nelumboides]
MTEHSQVGSNQGKAGCSHRGGKLKPVSKVGYDRLRPLHISLPASPLERHDLHELADGLQPPLMTFRKLAAGATSSTTAQVSPSIVVIIIVLTVIFFLSAFLHLLIRWLARNPSLIRRGLRAGTNGGSGPSNRIIALTALQGQLQQLFSLQDAGLDRSLIDGLPVFSYKVAADGLKDGADCAICLCEFVGDDQLRLLPSCGHAFHTDCIDTWLLSHSTCPLCRTLLLPECWLPGSLQPFLSSEISTVGEVEHQQSLIDLAVPTQSSPSGGIGSSSRRSSLSRITIVAGSVGRTQVDQFQCSEPSAEICENGNTMLNPAESGAFVNFNPAGRVMSYSAGLTSVEHGKSRSSIESSQFHASSEAENGTPHSTKMSSNEATSSVSPNPMISSSSAAALSDSGHLSYTSFGNNTDAPSGRYSDQLERASTHESGRRVSVHLGKCRLVNEQSRRHRKSKERGGASRRSYSKGSYEYVIDSFSNLEVLIPSQSTAPALISSARMNDLLNLSRRLSSSFTTDAQMPALAIGNVPRDPGCRSLSPNWASASFSKLRFCNGGDPNVSIVEAMNAPLNTLQPLDTPAISVGWPADVAKTADFEESSTATSMRAHLGSDASFSSGSASQKLQGLNVLGKNELSKNSHELESSKRAVSFRLPTPAGHHALNARLRASASRRALSESDDALSYWEPCLTTEERIQLGLENDSRELIIDRKTGSQRSASFAKRTMDWLVGWRGRMVQLHPDKSAINPS